MAVEREGSIPRALLVSHQNRLPKHSNPLPAQLTAHLVKPLA
jgi:hypothetical protein